MNKIDKRISEEGLTPKYTEEDIERIILQLCEDISKPQKHKSWGQQNWTYKGLPAPKELIQLKKNNEELFAWVSVTSKLRENKQWVDTTVHFYTRKKRHKIVNFIRDIIQQELKEDFWLVVSHTMSNTDVNRPGYTVSVSRKILDHFENTTVKKKPPVTKEEKQVSLFERICKKFKVI